MLYRISLHFAQHLLCIGQSLRDIGKQFIHFLLRLHPLLLCVKHSLVVVEECSGRHTNQPVMSFCIFFIDKMHIVCTHQFYVVLLRHFYQHLIHLLLQWISLLVGTGNSCFVSLQLKIIIFSEHFLKPQYRLLRLFYMPCRNQFRHLASQARRADNQILVIFFQLLLIRSRMIIITIRPSI